MTEESHSAATQRINAQLAERWPDLFNVMKPVPLAIGIYDALLEAMPDVTADQLRRVLSRWCNRPRYQAALTAGAERHGLEGVQGEVTEQQAADAAEMLKAAQTHFKAKAEAKRQAEKAVQAAARKKAEQAKAKEEAEAKKKAEETEAQKARQVEPPPVPPKPAPATAIPAGPVIMVKKRRLAQPSSDS
jgi:sRNA-binding protein